MGKIENKELAAAIRRIAREQQIEREEQFGRLRSKSWDGKESHKQKRRKFKQNAHRMLEEDYDADLQ